MVVPVVGGGPNGLFVFVTAQLVGPWPPLVSGCVRSPQSLEVDHVRHFINHGRRKLRRHFHPLGLPYTPPPLQKLTSALRSNPWSLLNMLYPKTRPSSSRRIAGICSSTQSQRHVDPLPPRLQLTHMALPVLYAGIYTPYCIRTRQYSRFCRHCPQGHRQATALHRLDP
jgi:hypothetical protein